MGMPESREWSYRSKDGSLVPVMLSVSGVHDERGAMTGYVAFAWDLTERNNSEQRSGRANLNKSLGGNSGHRVRPGSVGHEGVLAKPQVHNGQEISTPNSAHAYVSIQSWVFRRIVTGHSADRDRCPDGV
jgi:hypothetical protein